jgi:hypothetical protein
MLVRLRDFGAAHGHRLPDSRRAGEAFAAIGDAVKQLSDHAVAQLGLRRQGAKGRAAARAALLAMMEGISRTASAIQEEEPGFQNTFLLPERQSAQAVLTAAKLFARDLVPVAQQFVDHSMPETMIADFTRLLDTFEQAVRDRENGRGQTAAARVSIEAAIASGIAAARKLDVIIANHKRGDATILAEWERNRQIGRRRTSKAPSEAASSATTELSDATALSPSPPATPPVNSEPPVTLIGAGPDDKAA